MHSLEAFCHAAFATSEVRVLMRIPLPIAEFIAGHTMDPRC